MNLFIKLFLSNFWGVLHTEHTRGQSLNFFPFIERFSESLNFTVAQLNQLKKPDTKTYMEFPI